MTVLELHIGVLALQGSFREHLSLLNSIASTLPDHTLHLSPIRTPAQLSQVTALIIPGGESTAISLLLQSSGLLEPLQKFVREARDQVGGKAVWGTCAGVILLANEVVGVKDGYEGIGGVDVKVQRNRFGRQAESFSCELPIPFLSDPITPFQAIFIRAPVVHSLLSPLPQPLLLLPPSRLPTHPTPEPEQAAHHVEDHTDPELKLGKHANVVMLRQGNVLLSSFHPELGDDSRVHQWWLKEMVLPALI